MKLILVEWLDIHSANSWRALEEIEETCRPLHCKSVGWELCRKNGHITVLPHMYDEKKHPELVIEGQGEMIIPLSVVTKITVLRK